MSIGDTLAEARRQAGLTITQVSQQTRIRESIIRAIEQGDFSACGGDFYARGHIRSIAAAVGVDPVPLIREYDEEHGPPGSMRASQIFEPATPIKIREPRNLHLGWVLAVAVLGAGRLRRLPLLPAAHHDRPDRQRDRQAAPLDPDREGEHRVQAGRAEEADGAEAVIRLTAAQNCWVGLNSPTGQDPVPGAGAGRARPGPGTRRTRFRW